MGDIIHSVSDPAIKWDWQAKHRKSAGKVIIGRVNCMALFNVEEAKNNLGDPEYILENWFLSPQQITCSTFEEVAKHAERRLANFMTLCGFCHEDDKEADNG